MNKYSITGVVQCWTIHDLSSLLAGKDLTHLHPQTMPCLLTGMVSQDLSSRGWGGTAMRSSLMIGFNLQNMQVATQNSLYQLQGRGFFSTEFPEPYDQVVGEAYIKINGVEDGKK